MIQLQDEWKTAIDNALQDGCPIAWASSGADGQPNIGYFGSTQVFSEHELAIWMRTPARGFLQRIADNPKVAMLYRNPATRLAMQIHGEAHRVDDDAVKNRVYETAPEPERKADEQRAGTAVVVDIVRVIQRGQIVMSRDGDEGKAAD